MEAIAFVALIPVLAVLGFAGWLLWKVLGGVLWAVRSVLRLVGRLLRRILVFARGTALQGLHTLGALVTAAAVVPLALANLLIGRVAAARHYGQALQDEFTNVLTGLYRVAIAGPLRFLGLGAVLGGVERRLVDVVDHAPREAASRFRGGSGDGFPGYDVLGVLPSGGSGARLFLARPHGTTVERLRSVGRELPDRVVIKSFALSQGSTLPQIVRESRALEAASRLGLVLEHELRPDRFFYVTRYVDGERLDVVGNRLHARGGPEGLGKKELALVLGYAQDLLRTLHGFHSGGLWHKDVKPANVIVAGKSAHLVDFGLVTPLASALTLTTHGTEYYRDPEMVRLALQGVKVHEVDGVKFDLYSAGAVIYSLLEDSFPAQGSLSRITKRAPEALKWIVRRSMADIHARYGSAAEMLADLRVLAEAQDPFGVLPAELPSFRGEAPAEPLDMAFDAATGLGSRPSYTSPRGAAEPPLEDGLRPHEWLAQRHDDRRQHRRRRRRGLAVAAGVLVLFALVQAAHESVSTRRHASLTALASHVDPSIYQLDSYDRGILDDVRERLAAARAQFGTSTTSRASRAMAAEIEAPLPSLPEPPPEPAPASRFGLGSRVLVIEEGGSDELSARLTKELESQGVVVLSLRSGSADEDQVIGLIAGARHAMGLGSPEETEARLRLRKWLQDQGSIEGLAWLGAPEQDGGRRLLLVGPKTAESDGLYRLDGGTRLVSSR